MRRTNLGAKTRWANATQWLKHRREAVKKAVSSGSTLNPPILKGAISKMAKKLWSGKHKKEEEFNQKKEHGRRFSVGQFSQFLEGFF